MKVIFSDLDGTLLDSQTYSFQAAEPALLALRKQGTPLVLCTSKTRVKVWRDRLHIRHPFTSKTAVPSTSPKVTSVLQSTRPFSGIVMT